MRYLDIGAGLNEEGHAGEESAILDVLWQDGCHFREGGVTFVLRFLLAPLRAANERFVSAINSHFVKHIIFGRNHTINDISNHKESRCPEWPRASRAKIPFSHLSKRRSIRQQLCLFD